MTELFRLKQQTLRTNNSPEAAALVDYLKSAMYRHRPSQSIGMKHRLAHVPIKVPASDLRFVVWRVSGPRPSPRRLRCFVTCLTTSA